MPAKPLPPAEVLREWFTYDPESGEIRWRRRNSNKLPGTAAGTGSLRGYWKVGFQGTDYGAHRLIWRMMTGDDPGDLTIDHINGIKCDNRWGNLRLATAAENVRNRGLSAKNRTGVPGLQWNKKARKWMLFTQFEGDLHYQLFEDFDVAERAARELRERLHGKFVNHGDPVECERRKAAAILNAEMDRAVHEMLESLKPAKPVKPPGPTKEEREAMQRAKRAARFALSEVVVSDYAEVAARVLRR